jgi:thiamine transporter ThiT
LAEVVISGAIFFGSFAFGELAGSILSIYSSLYSARFFWPNKRNEQIHFELLTLVLINKI